MKTNKTVACDQVFHLRGDRKGCLLLTGKVFREEMKRLLYFLYFRNIKQSDLTDTKKY